MRRHRKDRRERKKEKNIIILSMVGIVCMLGIGYAAFSTNFTVSGKGIILDNPITIDELKEKVGIGGLYEDSSETNRYIYRGSSPNNYIIFNNEEYRILAIEADNNLKLMKSESIGAMPFDKSYNRKDSTYCTSSIHVNYGQNIDSKYGCNVWAAESGSFTNGSASGTLTKDASLNNYLNNGYYNALTEKAKSQMNAHDFYYGPGSEKNKIWHGNIGLINHSDYTNASLVDGCSLKETCLNDNYIYTDILESGLSCWTLNYGSSSSLILLDIHRGKLNTSFAYNSYNVYPVLFLNSNIKLAGHGTKENPYRLS